MSTTRILAAAMLSLMMAACGREGAAPPVSAPAASPPPDMHTSRLALDWAGTYEGVLPCVDCAGTRVRLALEDGGSFTLHELSFRSGAAESVQSGRFEWMPDGNAIRLDGAGGGRAFAVGEGRLILLGDDGSRPGPDAVVHNLRMVPASDAPADVSIGWLRDHRWGLESAVTASGQRIDALFPAGKPFEFRFEDDRLMVSGGCNGLRGTFGIDADGMLAVSGMASTLMACEQPLMDADQALAARMAKPLRALQVRGPQPTLVLISPEDEVLTLAGQQTPEAMYGPATRVFLEVAARTVPCPGQGAEAQCLEVREIRFDEQGIRAGDPGEWQAFAGTIEGYTHEPGVRNIVRVNRYQPPGEGAAPVHVLDLIVESEIVRD